MSELPEADKLQPKVVDMQSYVRLRNRIDNVLRMIDICRHGDPEDARILQCRGLLAKVIANYCESDNVRKHLAISPELLESIINGGEIPGPILDILETQHKRFRANVAYYDSL